LPVNPISWRHENVDFSTEQILEIFSSFRESCAENFATGKFPAAVRVVMVITVKHDFESAVGRA
jgi:hypothetical protein